jgi:hypothetical protein
MYRAEADHSSIDDYIPEILGHIWGTSRLEQAQTVHDTVTTQADSAERIPEFMGLFTESIVSVGIGRQTHQYVDKMVLQSFELEGFISSLRLIDE